MGDRPTPAGGAVPTDAASVDAAVVDRLADEEHLVATAADLVGIDTQNPPGETGRYARRDPCLSFRSGVRSSRRRLARPA